ncbi:MAG: MutS-like protein [Watsoniomyces obsoletus]|nr:MAG: MutS-like protein [Watsoniomyces obsoletus]
MDPSESFKELQERISTGLVETTRTVGQIAQEDISFQKSLDPNVSKSLDQHSSRLLRLADRLIQKAVVGVEVDVPRLKEQDDLEINWSGVVDVVDSLLERADVSLDEHTGLIKRSTTTQKEQIPTPKSFREPAKKIYPKPINILKPQLRFSRKPHYDDADAFKPLLTSKPHAIVPLEQSIVSFINKEGLPQHPYETEVIGADDPPTALIRREPVEYQPFDDTTATYVDTLEGLREMLAELKNAKEIAIDLEHHDARSYGGLVCLMQISTREKDWIVDTLQPWRDDLEMLNEVLTDPSILKVFHGAHMDIQWLQKDFGLYVVSLFDTYHAARVLGYPQASLASLLSRFVQFDADKQYQLADWRLRPLTDEMLKYARADTHFLLYIYDQLRNELIDRWSGPESEQSLIDEVLTKSKKTALLCHPGYIYDDDRGLGPMGWLNFIRKTPVHLSKEQFAVLKAVHRWRDRISRELDDGVDFTMPRHVLMSLARTMPTDMPSLLYIFSARNLPNRGRLDELLTKIVEAKAAGAQGPELSEALGAPPRSRAMTGDKSTPVAKGDVVTSNSQPSEIQADGVAMKVVAVRIHTSQFWGATLESPTAETQDTRARPQQSFQLTLPLPPLSAEIFEDLFNGTRDQQQEVSTDPGARAEHAFVRDRAPPEEDDGVFVIKQLGGRRKRKAPEVSMSAAEENTLDTSTPTVPVDEENDFEEEEELEDATQQRLIAKAKRKEERQAQKQLAREHARHQNDQGEDGEGGASSEPFDYAAAAVAQQADLTRAGRAPPPTQAFNPYAQSGDGPRAARAARKERPGRSMTFSQ